MAKPQHLRVKVGVRCRPAFQDEVDFAKGEFASIVDTAAEAPERNVLGKVSLTMITGKQRDFHFDYVFGPLATQDDLYDRMARNVVNDVLRGYNGTIFAYGQTGTGKTFTMGILEFVDDEHAGIIPRAISQIFVHARKQESSTQVTVSLSFLQLYRETIQDLLAPANNNTTNGAHGNSINSSMSSSFSQQHHSSGSSGQQQVESENLAIREDPQTGFYVEGLQEFIVRTYREAEALINLGLENRAIAPTLMNSTSSRSHTVLTLNIEQRVASGGDGDRDGDKAGKGGFYPRTLRSKLLMVDLAGSERVRRTVSKGARLSEAKSINTSLSALGNVIAALAEQNVAHVPYRDSKLTRLLQDSLGGTASTALIATVGPAPVNYGETLSTLLFASRCMAVKSMPVQHAEIDYAELCASLQAKLNEMEGKNTQKLLEQQEKYETIIRELQNELEAERANTRHSAFHDAVGNVGFGDSSGRLLASSPAAVVVANGAAGAAETMADVDLTQLLAHLEHLRSSMANEASSGRGVANGVRGSGEAGKEGEEGEGDAEHWLAKLRRKELKKLKKKKKEQKSEQNDMGMGDPVEGKAVEESALLLPNESPSAEIVALLGYSLQLLVGMSAELDRAIALNSQREEQQGLHVAAALGREQQSEKNREEEIERMASADPLLVVQPPHIAHEPIDAAQQEGRSSERAARDGGMQNGNSRIHMGDIDAGVSAEPAGGRGGLSPARIVGASNIAVTLGSAAATTAAANAGAAGEDHSIASLGEGHLAHAGTTSVGSVVGSVVGTVEGGRIGSHLARLSRLDAMSRVEAQYRSNSAPVSAQDRLHLSAASASIVRSRWLHEYNSADEVAEALTAMSQSLRSNINTLGTVLVRKDFHFREVKAELTTQLVEKRRREEEVINWSYILKYLLASSSKLRKDLAREKKAHADTAQRLGALSNPQTMLAQVNSTTGSAPPHKDVPSAEAYLASAQLNGVGSGAGTDGAGTGLFGAGVAVDRSPAGRLLHGRKIVSSQRSIAAPDPSGAFRKSFPSTAPSSPYNHFNSSDSFNAAASSEPALPVGGLGEMRAPADITAARSLERRHHDGIAGQFAEARLSEVSAETEVEREGEAETFAGEGGLFSERSVSARSDDASASTHSRSLRSGISSITGSMLVAAPVQPQQRNSSYRHEQIQEDLPPAASWERVPRHAAVGASAAVEGSSMASGRSAYAREVVQELGVDEAHAAAAMSVVEKVSSITPEQLQRLDPDTRKQIVQIRRELGIDDTINNKSGNNNQRREGGYIPPNLSAKSAHSIASTITSLPSPSPRSPPFYTPQGAPQQEAFHNTEQHFLDALPYQGGKRGEGRGEERSRDVPYSDLDAGVGGGVCGVDGVRGSLLSNKSRINNDFIPLPVPQRSRSSSRSRRRNDAASQSQPPSRSLASQQQEQRGQRGDGSAGGDGYGDRSSGGYNDGSSGGGVGGDGPARRKSRSRSSSRERGGTRERREVERERDREGSARDREGGSGSSGSGGGGAAYDMETNQWVLPKQAVRVSHGPGAGAGAGAGAATAATAGRRAREQAGREVGYEYHAEEDEEDVQFSHLDDMEA